MPKWTDEQQLAIDKDKTNIIVSAGAGSGKTAVLTARVIRKLKDGVDINKLLILTFTNAAAKEMKERIRAAIKKDVSLSKQLDLIDSAYITTFDSYSLSLVKKYHYLLGIEKNINIVDSSIMYCKKNEIIDSIFNDLYEKSDKDFQKMIYDFCIKNDKDIKNYILKINDKLDLLYDKEIYLNNYIDKFYNDDFINKNINLYIKCINNKIDNIRKDVSDLSLELDSDYITKLEDVLDKLFNSNSYNEIKDSLDFKLPILPKNSSEYVKQIKDDLSNNLKEIKSMTIYDSLDLLKNGILLTKDYIKSIINIIKKIDIQLNEFKKENNVYEFNDISKMAISVLKNNKYVCEELKNDLNEIMVDEYQDTSDLQEMFISLIENNNVYMVGDIKQSIYRFRNANPYIFKNKYDKYSENINGYKIDLNKNFRSRRETLDDINIIFNIVMDDLIGGADYIKSHQMIFGNNLYLENDLDSQNNNLEIYNYVYDKESDYSKEEIECFIVANDIINKVNNKYQIFDKDFSKLRDIKYSDFVILMDRATSFDLYKKIFEYMKIPLTKWTDTSVTDSNDILIFKNLIGLIIKYKKKEFDIEYKYCLTSIARSYLYRLKDEEIYNILEDNLIDNIIISRVKEFINDIDSISIHGLIDLLVEKFDFYNKLITVGNIKSSIIRIEYLYNIAMNVEILNYNLEDFYNYLNKLIEDNYEIKVSMSDEENDSVKIMTIHKSKGLEYPICYYTGIYKTFNVSDTKDRFLFSNDYGIITPYFNEGICKTIYSYLFKDKFMKEEISEKIRLFYVALTRCREKMIVVGPIEDKTISNNSDKLKYKSFLDIINSVYENISPFITDIDLSNINLSKDYKLNKSISYSIEKDERSINVSNINIDTKEIIKSRYSKSNKELIDSKTRINMKNGLKIHRLFELIDFKNPDLSMVEDKYKSYVNNFLNIGLDFNNCDIYKELEFVYNYDNNNTHGIIDLMLEYEDSIKIIDYKLNNILDSEYLNQLIGYKNYIEKMKNKKVSIYLYSIAKNELKEL